MEEREAELDKEVCHKDSPSIASQNTNGANPQAEIATLQAAADGLSREASVGLKNPADSHRMDTSDSLQETDTRQQRQADATPTNANDQTDTAHQDTSYIHLTELKSWLIRHY